MARYCFCAVFGIIVLIVVVLDSSGGGWAVPARIARVVFVFAVLSCPVRRYLLMITFFSLSPCLSVCFFCFFFARFFGEVCANVVSLYWS